MKPPAGMKFPPPTLKKSGSIDALKKNGSIDESKMTLRKSKKN